ncbi:MAG: sugar phosphate isomerase/epimerase [Planctomycetes bacterium]|nr:sugar phosphate isomerase/epimerase [Planctomycetota bacterium]
MKLSFMTWICPQWTIDQIIEGGRKYKYDGVELRVQVEHAHGVDLATGAGRRAEVRKIFEDGPICISAVATSLQFSEPEEAERRKSVDLLKQYIQLSADIGAPVIRVFGGAKGRGEPAGILDNVAACLAECAGDAEGAGVKLGLETHDYFSHSKYVAKVVEMVGSPAVQALWDVAHPYRHMETPEMAYANLKSKVVHLHIHDYKYTDEAKSKIELVGLGQGVCPHKEPMALLKADGFTGHFAVEVMKGDPDDVLPQYSEVFHQYLSEI